MRIHLASNGIVLLLVVMLCGCAKDTVVVGSKDFAENRLLAEMFAVLIEDAGLPVSRRIPLGDSAENFEALRTGAIHVYPEYTGTASALLGLPWTDETPAQIAREFAKLGIQLLPPLGFESSYVVLAREDFAALRGLDATGNLAAMAGELRLAVMEEFAKRPLDGLQPFLDRYGLAFTSVEVFPGSDHSRLYKSLLDGTADVVVGFATDSQISDFGLRVLDDDAGFFPTYAAMPLVAASAPAGVTKALAQLAGKIDAARMARLNAEVEIGYRDPRKVAIAELAELGLIDPGIIEGAPPLSIAVNQSEIGSAMANKVLQAARDAAPGRNVVLEGNPRPVSQVIEGSSRAALAPSVAQFEITSRGATLREDIETIAAVGSYYLHAFARTEGPDRLRDAATIATGPPGTPSEKLGRIIARSEGAEILTLSGADAETVIAALQSGKADAAIVIAPPGLGDVEAALLRTDGIRMIKADDWWQGSAKLGHPFLYPASLPAETYPPSQKDAVSTLAMQATVVGPGPPEMAMGAAGPSSYVEKAAPITDAVVLAFNEALGPHPAISPLLTPAAAMRPKVDSYREALNQTPAYTVLTLAILVFLGWALWLLFKPEKEH